RISNAIQPAGCVGRAVGIDTVEIKGRRKIDLRARSSRTFGGAYRESRSDRLCERTGETSDRDGREPSARSSCSFEDNPLLVPGSLHRRLHAVRKSRDTECHFAVEAAEVFDCYYSGRN